MEPLHVIGHRNPDTDAICSAIGYAAYLRQVRGDEVVAACCGEINARTNWVLKLAGVEPPRKLWPRHRRLPGGWDEEFGGQQGRWKPRCCSLSHAVIVAAASSERKVVRRSVGCACMIGATVHHKSRTTVLLACA